MNRWWRFCGRQVVVKRLDSSAWFIQRRLGHTHIRAAVISDASSGRILGVHVLGVNANEVINIYAPTVRHGLTRDRLAAVS